MSCYCLEASRKRVFRVLQKYQPLFKNKAIYRIVIYIKRFVRLVRFVFEKLKLYEGD